MKLEENNQFKLFCNSVQEDSSKNRICQTNAYATYKHNNFYDIGVIPTTKKFQVHGSGFSLGFFTTPTLERVNEKSLGPNKP
jgi:hypothetical protein